jgi:hypothetical protein
LDQHLKFEGLFIFEVFEDILLFVVYHLDCVLQVPHTFSKEFLEIESELKGSGKENVDMDASLHQVPDEVIEKLQTVAFDLVVYFGLFLEFITFGLQTRIIEGFQLEPVLLKH